MSDRQQGDIPSTVLMALKAVLVFLDELDTFLHRDICDFVERSAL